MPQRLRVHQGVGAQGEKRLEAWFQPYINLRPEAKRLVLDDEASEADPLLYDPVHISSGLPGSVPEVGLDFREPVHSTGKVAHLLIIALVLRPGQVAADSKRP